MSYKNLNEVLSVDQAKLIFEPRKNDGFGDLTMDYILNRIRQGKGFASLKLAHGFWELCVRFSQEKAKIGIQGEPTVSQWEVILNTVGTNWPVEIFLDLRKQFQLAHESPNLLNLFSVYGWRNGGNVEGTPIVGLNLTQEIIRSSISSKTIYYDALFWKDAVYDGSILSFIEELKGREVIVVGPDYIENFGEFSGLKKSYYIKVDGKKAAWQRDEILQAVTKRVQALGEKGVICLFEAGGVTSSWLVSKLHKQFPNSFFIALGQVLNICNVSKLENTNWFMAYRKEVCQTIEAINPKWLDLNKAYTKNSDFYSLPEKWRRRALKEGFDPTQLTSLIGELDAKPIKNDEAISFIENKPINKALLTDILSISQRENHWANFGPVSRLLENVLKKKMHISEGKTVVTCKSGTEAMHTIVRLQDNKAGRPLRWVISSFGFISSNIGPLANAQIVDCDPIGMLSLEELTALDLDSWDAVVVTNIFGLCDDISDYVDFCKKHNKYLLMDNATALFTPSRQIVNAPCEAISFHQTKPWGMGEGGCAVIDESDESEFRSLLNFGVGSENEQRQYAANGKLSDFDSALILQRLITMPKWRPLYRMQARRITKLARQCGLELLGEITPDMIMAHVPVLASSSVTKKALENSNLTLRKYYKPLTDKHPQASSIFERIINIPCHSTLAELDDAQIIEALQQALVKDRVLE